MSAGLPRLNDTERAYAFRAYRARAEMRYPFAHAGGLPGHPDGGYCLDALPVATGSTVRSDYVYEGR